MSPERVVVTVDDRHLTLSNLGKVLYPDSGFSKGEVLDYYSRIADVMLPHLAGLPGHLPPLPGWHRRQVLRGEARAIARAGLGPHRQGAVQRRRRLGRTESAGGEVEYPVIDDRPALIWAANLAAIEFHVPLWHTGRRAPAPGQLPGRPDHLVFDLDPGPGASIVECSRVACWIADRLASGRREPVAKTSGAKGMQVYVTLPARTSWDAARERALGLGQAIEKDHPELVVTNMKKQLRRARVLIDWSQNHPVKTTVAAYSLRGGQQPTVSAPVTWDEVTGCADGGDPASLRFTAGQVLDRVERLGDLFAPLADGAAG